MFFFILLLRRENIRFNHQQQVYLQGRVIIIELRDVFHDDFF